MTDALADLRRADAHARWSTTGPLALAPDAAAALAAAPVLLASYWRDEDEDEEDPGYEVIDGVAVVPIEGALMDRALWCWDGYDAIEARATAALADPRVRSMMLDLDSPGGMVAGLFDCMRALRAAKAAHGKRVTAWVGSGAYSACYGLASIADEIVLSDTAGVGSVGVIASLYSRAAQLAKDGVDVRVVASGTEKTDGHPAVPISDGAEARLRARVASLSAVFFDEVRAGRATLTTDVLSALDGGVRYGREAIAAGLADRVGTRAALLAELRAAAAARPTPRPPIPGASRASTEHDMNETTLTALRAATSPEADADTAVLALLARDEKNARDLASARSSIEQLSADLAAANARASEAANRIEKIERDAELSAAKAEGKWSASLEAFLTGLSLEQLRTWRASAPRVVPEGEIKAPAEEPRADVEIPSDVAALVAKAQRDGWPALSAGEKDRVARAAPAVAKSLRAKRSR